MLTRLPALLWVSAVGLVLLSGAVTGACSTAETAAGSCEATGGLWYEATAECLCPLDEGPARITPINAGAAAAGSFPWVWALLAGALYLLTRKTRRHR